MGVNNGVDPSRRLIFIIQIESLGVFHYGPLCQVLLQSGFKTPFISVAAYPPYRVLLKQLGLGLLPYLGRFSMGGFHHSGWRTQDTFASRTAAVQDGRGRARMTGLIGRGKGGEDR